MYVQTQREEIFPLNIWYDIAWRQIDYKMRFYVRQTGAQKSILLIFILILHLKLNIQLFSHSGEFSMCILYCT